MENIGREDYARFILDFARANMDAYGCRVVLVERTPPEGWSLLGQGSFRSVWRGPDGCAYKVQHRPHSGQSNEKEYARLCEALADKPIPGTRIPACSFYETTPGVEGVLVMECINGKTLYDAFEYDIPVELDNRMDAIGMRYSLRDMHSENVMYEEETDTLVPVDFGY